MEKHHEIYENFAAHCGRAMYKGREHLVMPDQLMPYMRAAAKVCREKLRRTRATYGIALDQWDAIMGNINHEPLDLSLIYEDEELTNLNLNWFSDENIASAPWLWLHALEYVFCRVFDEVAAQMITALIEGGYASATPGYGPARIVYVAIDAVRFALRINPTNGHHTTENIILYDHVQDDESLSGTILDVY